MKKTETIKSKQEFSNLIKSAKFFKTKDFVIYYKENNLEKKRFGIAISNKIGNAVTRNKLKRRVKDIIDKSGLHFYNKDYIIVLKKSANSAKYLELKEDIINLLKKVE